MPTDRVVTDREALECLNKALSQAAEAPLSPSTSVWRDVRKNATGVCAVAGSAGAILGAMSAGPVGAAASAVFGCVLGGGGRGVYQVYTNQQQIAKEREASARYPDKIERAVAETHAAFRACAGSDVTEINAKAAIESTVRNRVPNAPTNQR